MKCIIPCAGYGTRMGMSPDKSKEMLSDEEYKHIIDYSLTLCKIFNMEPLIITREEKKDLRKYLFKQQVKFIDIKVEGEWPQTVLKSEDYWDEDNILILPDTRFHSPYRIEDIQIGLELGNNAVIAVHEVQDPDKWGIIKDCTLYEKPQNLTGPQWAWGLIGFKDYYGVDLFKDLDKHNTNGVSLSNVGFVKLNSFIDITRGSK